MMENKYFKEIQFQINSLYQAYDILIANTLGKEVLDYEKAIEHALALIPKFLFDIYRVLCPEYCGGNWCDARRYFCFCINYNSTLFPNNRFHLHLVDQEGKELELKTFCFNTWDSHNDDFVTSIIEADHSDSVSRDIEQIESISSFVLSYKSSFDQWYDVNNPLVKLLDLFYDSLGATKSEFSMNRFFSEELEKDNNFLFGHTLEKRYKALKRTGYRGWYYVFDKNNYYVSRSGKDSVVEFCTGMSAPGIIDYLKEETYGPSDNTHNYINYASFLAEAAQCPCQHILALDPEQSYPAYINWRTSHDRDLYNGLFSNKTAKGVPLSFRQYNIPIFGFQENHSKLAPPRKVIGNLMIPSLVDIDDSVLSVFYEKADSFLNKISQYEKIVYANKNAVRSAIAQVMARNLSHNYGSHVLNHLLKANASTFLFRQGPYKCKYEEKDEKGKQEELFRQVLYLIDQLESDVYVCEDDSWKKEVVNSLKKDVLEKTKTAVKGILADSITNESLRQVVFLLNHIKCRVDYISDISFGAPMLQTTRCVDDDIFRELDRVSLLMNHISGLEENFEYEIQIVREGKLAEKEGRLQVAVPNDVVGTHAFYNILENIIRNTAKHSQGVSGDGVTFKIVFSDIDVEEMDKTLQAISFTNNVAEDKALKDKLRKASQELYCVEIYDTVKMGDKDLTALVNEQNKRLNEPIFKGERPRSHSLGLVEMEASAAYLRKLDSSVIDDERYHVVNSEEDAKEYEAFENLYFNQYGQLNLLKAIAKTDNETGRKCFGYRFFMLRPQEVLVVGDVNLLKPLHNPEEGVWVVGERDFCGDLKDGKVFNHEFVVYDGDETLETTIKQHKTSLSSRILVMDANAVWSANPTINSTIIKKDCWERWRNLHKEQWSKKCFMTTLPENEEAVEKYDDIAVYLDHAKELENEQKKTVYLNNDYYVEVLSSLAQNKLPSFNGDVADYVDDLRDCPELTALNLESVNTKVLALDERIQKTAFKEKDYGIGFQVHFKKMNVIVPELPDKDKPDADGINLSENNYHDVAKQFEKYIELHKEGCDFVLIHYGILERVFKSVDRINWKSNLDGFLERLTNSDSRVVLTSGRGVPDDLPDCVGFVSLSSITSALIDYKSKYLFNRLMYAARKSGRH